MGFTRIALFACALALASASFACAGEIEQRIGRSFEQIEECVRSGAMSRPEANRLKDQLQEVKRLSSELEQVETAIDRANEHRRHEGRRHEDDNWIQILSGTYGGNVGVPTGNVTKHLFEVCNGQKRCDYKIDYIVIGDPRPGRGKDYVAKYRCGEHGPIQTVVAKPEAGFGSVITLSCR